MKRALLFDLDDTLVPSTLSYEAGMRAIGIANADLDFQAARAEVKASCPNGYPASRSRKLYFKRYLERRFEFTPKRFLEMAELYERTVVEFLRDAWQKLDRSDLLRRLRDQGQVIGVVSNETTALQCAKLAAFDPRSELFDFIVTSEEVGQEKPHSPIFVRALELARTPASACVFIGDNFSFDIEGSMAHGMRAVQTIEFSADERRHSLVIANLNELPVCLSGLLAGS